MTIRKARKLDKAVVKNTLTPFIESNMDRYIGCSFDGEHLRISFSFGSIQEVANFEPVLRIQFPSGSENFTVGYDFESQDKTFCVLMRIDGKSRFDSHDDDIRRTVVKTALHVIIDDVKNAISKYDAKPLV